jgi:hypothetical protein
MTARCSPCIAQQNFTLRRGAAAKKDEILSQLAILIPCFSTNESSWAVVVVAPQKKIY